MSLLERLPDLLNRDRKLASVLEANAADREKDRNGSATSVLAMTVRFIGVAALVVEGDTQCFRQSLARAARLRLQLFERFAQGDPIDESYVSMLSYKSLFDALAAGDADASIGLAAALGGRTAIEKKHDHPFDRCLGYTLKAFVERDSEAITRWSTEFERTCSTTPNRDFAGYSDVFKALALLDEQRLRDGMDAVVRGHTKQSKRGGVFHGLEDEALCVWGIGIANLARMYGLTARGVPPLIPDIVLC